MAQRFLQFLVIHHHLFRLQTEERPWHATLRHCQIAHAKRDAAVRMAMLLAEHGGKFDGLGIIYAHDQHINELWAPQES